MLHDIIISGKNVKKDKAKKMIKIVKDNIYLTRRKQLNPVFDNF